MTFSHIQYKVRASSYKKVGFIYFNEGPLEMTNSAFYFIIKAISFLRYLYFSPGFFGYVGKRLDKKAKVNFKIYDVTN